VLTKRARRMREWFRWASGMTGVNTSTGAVTRMACDPLTSCVISADRLGAKIRPAQMQHAPAWPLPNVWLGVSVENQAAADERIPELLATPAAVRWISAEPLIGPVDLGLPRTWMVGATARKILRDNHARGAVPAHLRPPVSLDWIVAGCESGPGARSCDFAWLRSLRDQCAEAGVPYFLKQAVQAPGPGGVNSGPPGIDRFADVIADGPGSHRKAGGVIGLPYLDGVQHAAFPEVPRG
jgi:hypothetical protein